jgi:thioredoxin reductase (NADPH)
VREVDQVIIGAGPAGLTAGLYAGRYRLRTVCFEKMMPGGQIMLTPTIENFPGFPGAMATDELVSRMRAQAADVGVEFITDEVEDIVPREGAHAGYEVRGREHALYAKTIILACGAQPRRLGVAREEQLIGRGVSYCGTCDGPLYRGKDVVVVGGGDRAVEDALFLSAYCTKVTLVHRRQGFRASAILLEKIKAHPKIELVLDSVVERITGEERVEGVAVKNTLTGASSIISCSGLFIFVGIVPNTGFLKERIALDEAGYIITDSHLAASRAGVFACGDCRQKGLYQVVTACGDGAQAVYAAHKYLLELPSRA